MVVLPNFVPAELDAGPPPASQRSGSLFVGRLSDEKGVVDLIRSWPEGEHLSIVGDGPQRKTVAALSAGNKSVTFLGRLPRAQAVAVMRRHRWLVFPSRSFEALPLVYPEALACGLPVIAFYPSAVAHLVTEEGTGFSVHWHEPWSRALSGLSDRTPSPEACRRVFETRYSETAFVQQYESMLRTL
jgi:glycosyltransferase involved in cell wall biosynthesis